MPVCRRDPRRRGPDGRRRHLVPGGARHRRDRGRRRRQPHLPRRGAGAGRHAPAPRHQPIRGAIASLDAPGARSPSARRWSCATTPSGAPPRYRPPWLVSVADGACTCAAAAAAASGRSTTTCRGSTHDRADQALPGLVRARRRARPPPRTTTRTPDAPDAGTSCLTATCAIPAQLAGTDRRLWVGDGRATVRDRAVMDCRQMRTFVIVIAACSPPRRAGVGARRSSIADAPAFPYTDGRSVSVWADAGAAARPARRRPARRGRDAAGASRASARSAASTAAPRGGCAARRYRPGATAGRWSSRT